MIGLQDPYTKSVDHPDCMALKEAEEPCELQIDRLLKIRFKGLFNDKFAFLWR